VYSQADVFDHDAGKYLGKKKMSVQTARWNVWMMFQPGKKQKRMTTQNMERWVRRWLKCNGTKNGQAVARNHQKWIQIV